MFSIYVRVGPSDVGGGTDFASPARVRVSLNRRELLKLGAASTVGGVLGPESPGAPARAGGAARTGLHTPRSPGCTPVCCRSTFTEEYRRSGAPVVPAVQQAIVGDITAAAAARGDG